jgi:hypothetical protein
MEAYGVIEEVSASLVGGSREVYGIVKIGDIRVIGCLSAAATPGDIVEMVKCGINEEGCFFCCFETVPTSHENQKGLIHIPQDDTD